MDFPAQVSHTGPVVRDDPAAVARARARPIAERLELALSWNSVASELRGGLAQVTGRPAPRR